MQPTAGVGGGRQLGPGQILLLAGGVTAAVLCLVLGCVVDDNWLSLVTVTQSVAAVCTWLLFRPGNLCVPPANDASLAAVAGRPGTGICGGQLCAHWGQFLTAFFACSTAGMAAMLWHSDKVHSMLLASSCINASIAGDYFCESMPYHVKCCRHCRHCAACPPSNCVVQIAAVGFCTSLGSSLLLFLVTAAAVRLSRAPPATAMPPAGI